MMERNFFQNRPFQRDFFYPMDNFFPQWDDMFRPWNKFPSQFDKLTSSVNQLSLKDAGSSVVSDKEKFQISVDVQHFAPEDISVKVVDGSVIVEGKHEEKRDEHGYISRQFVRRYTLPQGCLPDTVESRLSSDGVLTVTAPTVIALPSSGERIVPIAHTGPVQQENNTTVADAK